MLNYTTVMMNLITNSFVSYYIFIGLVDEV